MGSLISSQKSIAKFHPGPRGSAGLSFSASLFLITNVVMNAAGGVQMIDWTPNLSDRDYRVLGKTNLSDGKWHYPTNDASRFFKVEVRLK